MSWVTTAPAPHRGDDPSLVVTSQDLCWQDTVTCRVDVRVFDRERVAAVTAAADDDTERVLVHASRALTEYRGACAWHRLSAAADRRPGR